MGRWGSWVQIPPLRPFLPDLMTGGKGAAGGGQLADQPVRLQRVGEPGLGPASDDAAAHRLLIHALAPFVEEGELAARLIQAAAQPDELCGRGLGTVIGDGSESRFLLGPLDHGFIVGKSSAAEKTETAAIFAPWPHGDRGCGTRLRVSQETCGVAGRA